MSVKPNKIIKPSKTSELNLEQIDKKKLMEQVRQNGSKMEWTTLAQDVRRNLLEKQNNIDADGRIDVLKGLAFMRTKLPIDAIFPIEENVKTMAESLGCSYTQTSCGWSITKQEEVHMDLTVNGGLVTTVVLSFWEEPSFYSPDATLLLQNGHWAELRGHIARILATYEKEISRNDRTNCKGAIEMLKLLFTQVSQDSSFTSIHRSKYGYYLPSEDLRQGRVYYNVDPLYRNFRARNQVYHLSKDDYEKLPYFEIAFVKSYSPCSLLSYNTCEQRFEIVDANVAICLKLSKGTPMREHIRRRLKQNDLRTNSMINMIYLAKWEDIHKIVKVLRNEAAYMILRQLIRTMCIDERVTKSHWILKKNHFEICFETESAPIKVYIRYSGGLEAKVEVVHALTEMPIAEGLNDTWSRKLNECWNISLMMEKMISWEGNVAYINNVKKSPRHLLTLPYVVLSRINDHLDFLSQARTRKVCKDLRNFIDQKNCQIDHFHINCVVGIASLVINENHDKDISYWSTESGNCTVEYDGEEFEMPTSEIETVLADIKSSFHNKYLQLGTLQIHIDHDDYKEIYNGMEEIMRLVPNKQLHTGKVAVEIANLKFFGESVLPYLKTETLKSIEVRFLTKEHYQTMEMFNDIDINLVMNEIGELDQWKQATRKCLMTDDLFYEESKEVPVELIRYFNVIMSDRYEVPDIFDEESFHDSIECSKKLLDMHNNVEKCEVMYTVCEEGQKPKQLAILYQITKQNGSLKNERIYENSKTGTKTYIRIDKDSDYFIVHR